MANYDVFNGDADGICALLQLRLAEPREAILITGVKRDINLLAGVDAAAGDQLTVLDVSMEKNLQGLQDALSKQAKVFYVDHHFPGDIPADTNLNSIINEAADTCTSILVNTHLKGQFIHWAITGAFGDNLKKSARALAQSIDLGEADTQALENLGTYINYNGYGASLDDLHFKPADLYQTLLAFPNPLDFIHSDSADFIKLEAGYHGDMAKAQETKAMHATDKVAVFSLPNETWARRVSGVYSNDLTNGHPDRAHAVLTEKDNGNYLVSVRAPLSNKQGAVDLCRQFPTGGGRAAAAGINDLPAESVTAFIDALSKAYP
jgi:nanoRNase/pAp phosphatase (c-di-AMP/oligoRNAs hydrolase)